MQLESQLPPEPIEDPASWAWGQHPNGLGYKVIFKLKVVIKLVRRASISWIHVGESLSQSLSDVFEIGIGNMGISVAHLGIAWAYLRCIFGTIWAYHGHFFGLIWKQILDILGIYVAYLMHLLGIFLALLVVKIGCQ